jgi:uncharacterized protein
VTGLNRRTETGWRQSGTAYIHAEARPADKYGHQPRLYALACQIGAGMSYDDDVLFAATWMHDLGVFIGHRPEDPEALKRWDHVPYTIARTRELLAGWGFSAEKLDLVAEAIRTHQPGDEPQSTEAILLRDADILEQLGAIGALRALVKVGRDTRYATFSSVLHELRAAADRLPGLLRLETSRQLASRRVAALRAFLAAVEDEAGENLY